MPKPAQPDPSERLVSTGIAGLDEVLGGGFVRGGLALLQGEPGTGKTTLGLQFLFDGAAHGETGMYVSLTEDRRDIERICAAHGWDIGAIDVADMTRNDFNQPRDADYLMFQPTEVELGETTRQIVDEIERVRPRRLIFDGMSELRLLAAEPLRYRRQLLALKQYFDQRGITVLLLDDRTQPLDGIGPESLVGSNLMFERTLPVYGGMRRRLVVTKVRGESFRHGFHEYEIVPGGIVVHPRVVASGHPTGFARRKLESGVPNLDTMLAGGLHSGTTTLLLGPAGVGKSTCAMTYVAAALKAGDAAAVFTFDEVLANMFERSRKLCDERIESYIEAGKLHAQQIDPTELGPGAFARRVMRLVANGTTVVLIDSLNGYMSAMPDERFLATHLHELFTFLNEHGVVTIVTVAQHGLLAGPHEDLDVSYLADTVLLLRYFEASAQIRQAISVFKNRIGPHERMLRELLIDDTGIRVGDPLHDFEGILTGVPTYRGHTKMLPERAGGHD